MSQFNIRDMPERALQQLEDIVNWTGYTKTQIVLIAIENLWKEVKKERQEKMSKNTRERFIDQVASIVSERVRQTQGAISFEEAVEDAKKINDSDHGFTFDLRDPGQRENNWSRYENVSLDEQEMKKAIGEAKKLLA